MGPAVAQVMAWATPGRRDIADVRHGRRYDSDDRPKTRILTGLAVAPMLQPRPAPRLA